ncbi:MAG TPA: YkgJ family cysteine cluster protein [Polyangiaceae bacterium]|nr:YkgJ family cysteine cluster protein [Polyangiaceae bacterium]
MSIGPKRKRHLQMAARVREVYDQHDTAMARSLQTENVQCRRGCAACCNQFVGVSYPEAVAIYVRYPALVNELLPRLAEDSALLEEIVVARGIDENDFLPSADVRNAICHDWWKLRRPCTFLDPETKDCRIYEARPASCRTYHVTSDPYYCGTDDASQVRIVSADQGAFGLALAWANGGRNVVMGPLGRMLIIARAEMRESGG